MFNIGGGELLVIGLVALIVLGPQRLPDAARQAGKVLGDLRRLSTGFQEELKGALSDAGPSPGRRTGADGVGRVSAADSATNSAIAAVSEDRPRRRTPLQAAPQRATDGKAKPSSSRAKQAKGQAATSTSRPRPRDR